MILFIRMVGALVHAEQVHLVAAECNGYIISCGHGGIEQAGYFLNLRQHAYLGFMYTVSEFCGGGVNKRILDELMGWAQSKIIRELRPRLYFDNVSARKAYGKAGFT